jgi:hypothetical protein
MVLLQCRRDAQTGKGARLRPTPNLTPADVQKLRISSFKTKPQHTGFGYQIDCG